MATLQCPSVLVAESTIPTLSSMQNDFAVMESLDMLVVSNNEGHRLDVFSLARGSLVFSYGGLGAGDGQFYYPTAVISVPWHPHHILVYDATDRVQEINIVTIRHVRFRYIRNARRLLVSNDGQELLVSSGGPTDTDSGGIHVWSVATDQLVRTISSHGDGPDQLLYPTDMVLDPDGTLAVAQAGSNRISLFRYSDGAFLRTLTVGEVSGVVSMVRCECGYLVVGTFPSIVLVPSDGRPATTLSTNEPEIWGLAVAPFTGKVYVKQAGGSYNVDVLVPVSDSLQIPIGADDGP